MTETRPVPPGRPPALRQGQGWNPQTPRQLRVSSTGPGAGQEESAPKSHPVSWELPLKPEPPASQAPCRLPQGGGDRKPTEERDSRARRNMCGTEDSCSPGPAQGRAGLRVGGVSSGQTPMTLRGQREWARVHCRHGLQVTTQEAEILEMGGGAGKSLFLGRQLKTTHGPAPHRGGGPAAPRQAPVSGRGPRPHRAPSPLWPGARDEAGRRSGTWKVLTLLPGGKRPCTAHLPARVPRGVNRTSPASPHRENPIQSHLLRRSASQDPGGPSPARLRVASGAGSPGTWSVLFPAAALPGTRRPQQGGGRLHSLLLHPWPQPGAPTCQKRSQDPEWPLRTSQDSLRATLAPC